MKKLMNENWGCLHLSLMYLLRLCFMVCKVKDLQIARSNSCWRVTWELEFWNQDWYSVATTVVEVTDHRIHFCSLG